jgi:transposase
MSDIRLSCAEAAKLIGVSPRTLERWRYERRGPKFLHPRPGRPFYLARDILKWMASGYVPTRESPRFSAEESETIESLLTDFNAEDDAP